MQGFFSQIKKRLFQQSTETLSSVDAYALWAQSYPAEAHNVLMQIEQDTMLTLMPILEDKLVLDLACGTGRYGKIAQMRGAASVIGIDNSPDMLKNSAIQQVALASTEIIPLASSTIDVVLCGLALGHLPTLQASIREISRILKPDGVALISDFHPYQFLSGARRTFQSNNTTYAVEHHVHHLSDYFSIGEATGLQLSAISEPCYEDHVPVVLVLRYIKK